jgi:phenylalanyl-tRNA synthetase beta chain
MSWLAEHADAGLPAEELARRLSGSGTLVEAIHHLGVPDTNGNLASFRVGRVLSAEQHPNADRLRVCSVDLGGPEPAGIVCGAPNVAAGQTVAVALPGALLPGADKPLGVAKLRGVESRGMILSSRELGLGDDHSGIMELPEGPAPGTPLAEVLPLAETILELEITSNRPDCLSVYGVAREVHAVTGAELRPLDESDPPALGEGDVRDLAAVEVLAPDLCPRYMARVLTGVSVGPSPPWLARRLEAAGMRAILRTCPLSLRGWWVMPVMP